MTNVEIKEKIKECPAVARLLLLFEEKYPRREARERFDILVEELSNLFEKLMGE